MNDSSPKRCDMCDEEAVFSFPGVARYLSNPKIYSYCRRHYLGEKEPPPLPENTVFYFLFCGEQFYPNPGWEDFFGMGYSKEILINLAKDSDGDWAQIVEIKVDDTFINTKIIYTANRKEEFNCSSPFIWEEYNGYD